MTNLSKSDYLKSQAEKINKLFLSGKFDLVIEKSKKILEKNPKQVPFYNFLGIQKFNNLAKYTNKKVICLGGIKKNNLNKTKLLNTYGFSSISFFKKNIKYISL